MIDDLVKYCLTEVAYEGELGCTVDRLKELITRFSETPLSSSSMNPPKNESNVENENPRKNKQNVDDAYCAYVYSLIAKHPSIIIGTVPDGTPPVWIAPPPHKKGQAPPPPPVSLNVIEGAKEKSMGELKERYGSQLRIAADKVTCFVALTGSHNRPSRLSDTVYSTLQVITRAREKGVPIKDLGPMTKYDPKSIFYQISQLVDMNLVVKIAKGPSLNWAVLKKFYERSLLWQRIMGEKEDAPAPFNELEGSEQMEAFGDEESGTADLVANVPLLRHRVLKLVERSTNQIHQYSNMIVSAGFANPTKPQRRFFTSRLNGMIQEGLLEKLAVPTNRGTAICVKLTDKGKELLGKPASQNLGLEIISAVDENLMQAEIEDEEFVWTKDKRPSRGIGLQRQIISLLDANPSGLIIREMSQSLGNFDRRTIEQVLTRLCTRVPPRHLANLHPVTVMETEGKMRRQRYFTLKHYRQLLEDQNLPDDRYNWIHMDDIGGYSYADETMFYNTPAELSEFIATVQENRSKKTGKGSGNPPAPPKKRPNKNPIIDGVVKRGRPRKDQNPVVSGEEGAASSKPAGKKAQKRKAEELELVVEGGVNPTSAPPLNGKAATSAKSRKKKKADLSPEVLLPSKEVAPTLSEAQSGVTQAISDPQDAVALTEDTAMDSIEPTNSAEVSNPPATSPLGPSSALPDTQPSKAKVVSKKKKRHIEDVDVATSMPPKKKQKLAVAKPLLVKETGTTSDPISNGLDVRQVEAPLEPEKGIEPAELIEKGPAVTTDPPPKLPAKPQRRPKQQKPRAMNVSELRRQQEIMDVLLANDGIMQLNTEMAIHLRDRVQELAENGIQTGQSAGFLSDKKTIGRAVAALEERGQVKVIKTVILDPNRRGSLQQPTTIIYHPDTSQEKIQAFMATLQKPYKATHIPATPVVAGEVVAFSKSSKRRAVLPRDDTGQSEEITPVMDPRQKFLEDRQTVAQLFGFLLGRSRRAQELYLFTLSHILSDSPSPSVISVEERIISTDYWTEDYPLGSFCAIIPTQVYVPYLEAAQGDSEALNQPLKSLDSSLRSILKTNHARARIRFMELFTVLHALQLLTPLQAAPDGPILVTDARDDDAPRRFAEVEMPSGVSARPPTFWKFNKSAPIWLLAQAKFTSQTIEVEPSFYKDLPIVTVEDAVTYWSVLQRVSDRQTDFVAFDVNSDPPPSKSFNLSAAVLASLCHFRGWTAEYRLSKLQEEYLKDMVDIAQLTTPLSDPTPDRLMQAAFVTCAPQPVICAFFSTQATRLEGAYQRIERKKKKKKAPGPSQEDLQNSLTQKAQKHLQDVGDRWDRLVTELVGETLSSEDEEKLRPLRSRYITVGGVVDEERLKELIETVMRNPVELVRNRYQTASSKETITQSTDSRIRQAEEAMPHLDRLFGPPRVIPPAQSSSLDPTGFPPLPPLVTHQTTTLVVDIVHNMGTAPEGEEPKPKRSRISAMKVEGPKPIVSRRKRFNWNDEYEELLRDTVAIIRARCREKARGIRWGPAESVFPPVRANNIRIHFNKYVTQPGAASYMDRLERAWYKLWTTHRGRPELPDNDPTSPEGCDMITHIQFLRNYLDKRKMLSSVEEREESPSATTSKIQPELPRSISDLYDGFKVEEQGVSPLDSILQQYWGDQPAYLNERTHIISAIAFTETEASVPEQTPLEQSVAESVIQMIVATEQESYKEEVATALLTPFGDEAVKQATMALWKRGTVTKVSRARIGRGYRMSDSNVEDLHGRFPVQRLEDAAAVETVFQEEPDEWRTWSINATEGEMSALLHRVSRHEAEFKIQLPDLKMARDLTSRKIPDEVLETSVDVLFAQPEPGGSTPSSEDDLDLPDATEDRTIAKDTQPQGRRTTAASPEHGKAIDGKRASCMIIHGSQLVNCAECLLDAQRSLLAQVSKKRQKENTRALLAQLEKAGKMGLDAEDVWAPPAISSVAHSVINSLPPLAFWSGYTKSCLISTKFLGDYAIWLPGDESIEPDADPESHLGLVMPRRWVDLRGKTVFSTWKSALRAVVGLLLARPLVGHNQVFDHFRKVYDRLDMIAVLRYLEDEGVVRMVREGGDHAVGQMTLEEERRTFWELEPDFEWRLLL